MHHSNRIKWTTENKTDDFICVFAKAELQSILPFFPWANLSPPQYQGFILNQFKYSWILLASRIILYQQTNMTTMIGACPEKKNVWKCKQSLSFRWKIYLMVLFMGIHWTVIFSSKMNFNPFSMSMNQFMNDLVWTLKISIYRNTLINIVAPFFPKPKSNLPSMSSAFHETNERKIH